MANAVTNIVIAGLGGQGVVTASGIVAEAAFRAGFDVKQSELHGMSQRGGSVRSDVRFGTKVFSPMVPAGETDFLVVLASDQVDINRQLLRPGGVLITPESVDDASLPNTKSLNVALLGILSRQLALDERCWFEAIRANLPEKLQETNLKAFAIGRAGPVKP